MAPLTIIEAKFCMMGAVTEKLPKKLAERLHHWCSKSCSGSTVAAGDPMVMVVEMMVMWYDGGGDF